MTTARFVLALQAARQQLEAEADAAQARVDQVWRDTFQADATVILHRGRRYETGPRLWLVPTGEAS